ncbi:MAG: methyltransferase domain-containing protein [Candidatus Hydrogenedentes bacterium]|nr:methyltransferase domain-containing protein [Candidatus Hydrogenedentota bacterium]
MSGNNHHTALKESKTFGPVPDLERHLPSEWWRTLFNAVYLKTDGDVVENSASTESDVDLLVASADLRPEDAILDLCCGQGRHALELARRGFQHVTGLDRSRYLVRLARKRNKRRRLSATFREGDARKLRLAPESFDCVSLMGNSFGYFERAEDDLAVLTSVWRVLKPGGRVVLDVVDGEWMRQKYEPRSWEWIDENHFVCRERALAQDGQRLISREIVTHAERGVIADQFYAERLYTYPQLVELLERAGFKDVRQGADPTTHSSRQQDLGMLSRRICLVASKPVYVGRRPRRGPLYPNVTVLLGDPSQPDAVKREGVFSTEDIETIERMRAALGALKDYEFRYWTDHHGLFRMLQEDRPDFVLNLCDEGFHNDPFKEMHVAAALEMFGVPYSGAAPRALGLCYDKALVRAVAHSLDIPVPLESFFAADDQMATLPSVFPALVKPNLGDSSQGITQDAVVHNKEQFIAYWERLRSEFPDRPLLVQEFLSGNEYSVGVIGNPGSDFLVLPVLEVDYSGLDPALPRILGYESKWQPDSPYWNDIRYKVASLDAAAKRQIVDNSLVLFERLGCRDYARFDFRADANGVIKLLEANPNPGWCWDGKLNIMAGYADYTYADVLRIIIETAQLRYGAAPALDVSLPAGAN